jgi:hypothetical protein
MEGKMGICIDCKASDFLVKEKGFKYDLGFKTISSTKTGSELADYYI